MYSLIGLYEKLSLSLSVSDNKTLAIKARQTRSGEIARLSYSLSSSTPRMPVIMSVNEISGPNTRPKNQKNRATPST